MPRLAFTLVLLIPFAAAAQTIYVDGGLAQDCPATYDPSSRSCGSGSADAYRTFQAADGQAGPGTVVLVRGGQYTEVLAPSVSGNQAQRIAWEAFTGESVVLTGTNGPAIQLDGVSYISLGGLSVEDTQWLESTGSHHNTIQDCTFLRTPSSGTTGNLRFIQSHHNRILGNTIDDGNDNLLLIASDRNIVEGNIITEGRHSVWGIRCGNYNVIRGNVFGNSQQKIGEVYDCGADTSAVPNAFDATKHNLIEGNTFLLTTTYYSTSGGNGIQYAGQNGIVRRNVFYANNVGLGMQIYADEAEYNHHNRVSHNVFYDNECGGIAPRSGGLDNLYVNNALYLNRGVGPAGCSDSSPAQIVYRNPMGGFVFTTNLIRSQAPGEAVIQDEFGSGDTLAEIESSQPALFSGNLEVDPGFVDATGHDFRLESGSALIDAGGFLTRTASAGSGASMMVEDAGWFHDGFGIEGEQGDLVQLEGQTERARVVAVDYDAHVLTLDRALTWTDGQGLHLPYEGLRPDVGAFEHGGGDEVPPAAPENLQVQ